MFRSKKTSAKLPEGNANVDVAEIPAEPAVPAAQQRRTPQMPPRALGGGLGVDMTRRFGDISALGNRPDPSSTPSVREKTLVVGKDVRLKGEVSECERMTIEGRVDIKVSECRLLQIGQHGIFNGVADVREAEIAGRFEGTLTAHERLTVRATGRARGTFRYGSIVIEAGGEIVGEVGAIVDGGEEAILDGSPELVTSSGSHESNVGGAAAGSSSVGADTSSSLIFSPLTTTSGA